MAYNANMYMPYQNNWAQGAQTAPYNGPMPNTAQPYDARVKVNGMKGAEAFWMPPNSHAILFDSDSDVMYYKWTDAAGYGSIIDFDFFPRNRAPQEQAPSVDYVSRSEFDALVAQVMELKNNGEKGADDGK